MARGGFGSVSEDEALSEEPDRFLQAVYATADSNLE